MWCGFAGSTALVLPLFISTAIELFLSVRLAISDVSFAPCPQVFQNPEYSFEYSFATHVPVMS